MFGCSGRSPSAIPYRRAETVVPSAEINAAFGVAIAAEKRWCPTAAPVGAASYAR